MYGGSYRIMIGAPITVPRRARAVRYMYRQYRYWLLVLGSTNSEYPSHTHTTR